MHRIINQKAFSFIQLPILYFSNFKQPHEILGISKNANQIQIKSAFYKLAKTYHPDLNSDVSAHNKFNIIKNAYQQMMNKKPKNEQQNKNKKQRSYKSQQKTDSDIGNDEEFNEEQQFQFQQFSKAFQEYMRKGFIKNKKNKYEKYFKQVFSDQAKYQKINKSSRLNLKQQQQDDYDFVKGSLDIGKKIHIDINQIGTQKIINITKNVICPQCKGKTINNKRIKCKFCKGKGQIQGHQKCRQCKGTGKQKKSVCNSCNSKGLTNITVSQLIPIPLGLNNRDKIVVEGRGNQQLKRGKFGNLIIQFIIKNQNRQKNENKRINSYGQLQISISQAVLGLDIMIETVAGMKNLNIPCGIQDGEVIKISGGGYKKSQKINKNGDHYVKIKIDIPKKISKQQKCIFQKIKKMQ